MEVAHLEAARDEVDSRHAIGDFEVNAISVEARVVHQRGLDQGDAVGRVIEGDKLAVFLVAFGAGCQDIRRVNRADRVADLDIIIIHRGAQALAPLPPVWGDNGAEGDGFGDFGLQVRVAASDLVAGAGLAVDRVEDVEVQRAGADVEQVVQRGRADVARDRAAEAELVVHIPGRPGLPGGDRAADLVVRAADGAVEVQRLGEGNVLQQRHAHFDEAFLDGVLAVVGGGAAEAEHLADRAPVAVNVQAVLAGLGAERQGDRAGRQVEDVAVDGEARRLLLDRRQAAVARVDVVIGRARTFLRAEHVPGNAARLHKPTVGHRHVGVGVDVAADDVAAGVAHRPGGGRDVGVALVVGQHEVQLGLAARGVGVPAPVSENLAPGADGRAPGPHLVGDAPAVVSVLESARVGVDPAHGEGGHVGGDHLIADGDRQVRVVARDGQAAGHVVAAEPLGNAVADGRFAPDAGVVVDVVGGAEQAGVPLERRAQRVQAGRVHAGVGVAANHLGAEEGAVLELVGRAAGTEGGALQRTGRDEAARSLVRG